MKTTSTPLYGLTTALLTSAALLPHAEAITITTDSFTDFDMDFAEVGDTTNVDDAGRWYCHGAVSYEYRMGVNEVSEAMIDAYNGQPFDFNHQRRPWSRQTRDQCQLERGSAFCQLA